MRNKPLPGFNKLPCGCMGVCKCPSPLKTGLVFETGPMGSGGSTGFSGPVASGTGRGGIVEKDNKKSTNKYASPIKVDLTKKSGLGPREKETNIVKFEMGNPLGIENPVALNKLYEKTEKKRK